MGDDRDESGLRVRITQLEDERAKLLLQQEALKQIVSSIPYFVFWKDSESNYLGANKAFAALGGFDDPDAIVGKSDYDMPWTRAESDFYRSVDRQVMAGKKPILDVEETQLGKDGRTSTVLTSKVPLFDANGDVTGILGIYTDISARKQLELDLQRAKEEAEATSRAKTEFFATVSHELRTPLALVLGPLDMLGERDDLPDDVRRTLRAIRKNGWRLKNLLDDVLDFSKVDAGKAVLDREPTEVDELVAALVEETRSAAVARSIELRFIASGACTCAVDRRMVERMVLNLIGNALKFTDENGRVDVSVVREDGEIVIGVQDDGIGISAEDQPRLFHRFQQADASTTRKYGGTGLGLALVKEYAELHGGRAAVASTLGHGSRFTVRIPVVHVEGDTRGMSGLDSAAIEARLDGDAPSKTSPLAIDDADQRPVVVLAEDNSELRAHVTEVLSEYRVIGCANGREALAAAKKYRPSVVLTDMMMPEMDGRELLAKVKSDTELQDTPVIVLTAFATRSRVAETLDAGADDFLEKPFTQAELRARVGVARRLFAGRRELVATNAQLLATIDRAVETEKLAALGRMLSQVAHELNNPMCAVLGNIEPLGEYVDTMTRMLAAYGESPVLAGEPGEELRQQREALDVDFAAADVRECLACIREGVERVRGLQSDLRSFLRGGSGTHGATFSDINEGLRTTIDMLRRGLPPDVQLRASYGTLPGLAVNVGQLKQVLLNLLQNAIDAVGARGVIDVETTCANDVVTIRVADDGPGIRPSLRPKIFEPFFTTKDVGKGTGLGLAICRQILQAHGGRIHLADADDGKSGAHFVIELPAKRSA